MTRLSEDELWAGYQEGTGWYVSACACGVDIVSETGTTEAVAAAIRDHQDQPVHQQWREWQAAVEALRRPTRHRCPCHNHGEGAA